MEEKPLSNMVIILRIYDDVYHDDDDEKFLEWSRFKT